MRLKPEQMEKFKDIAKTWGWQDIELGSRLVDFFASLDHECQQYLLGLPMKAEDQSAVADRILKAVSKMRKT